MATVTFHNYVLEQLTHAEYEELKALASSERSVYDGSTGRSDDDDSSYERFKRLINKCVHLGSGCARDAYLVAVPGRTPFVFKHINKHTKLHNDGLDGPDQMEHELSVWADHTDHPHVPKIYECARDHVSWMEMEYLRPIACHVDLDAYARYKTIDVERLAQELDVAASELGRLVHWGIDAMGNLKVLDMGAAYDVYAST